MDHNSPATVNAAAALRTALRLQTITVAWMVVEAAIAIGAGIVAGSLLLLVFGIDSVIELLSASLVIWQLRREARSLPEDATAMGALREKVSRWAGYLLYALSLYVAVQAAYGLVRRNEAETSPLGIAVAAVAAIAMPFLAKAKNRAAMAIGSRALRADAMETLTCGYLAWILLAGLIANAVFHWWWLDSAASLAIVPLLLREAKEAVSGGDCCGNGEPHVPNGTNADE